MVELRKRPSAPSDAPQPPQKKQSKPKGASPSANGSIKATTIGVGDSIDLDKFGGEVETQDGLKTSLKKLVDDSKNGIVLFTYPKASTPGCK